MNVCLDLDIGNTNTKWRCGENRGTVVSPSVPLVDTDIHRVRIATVAGFREVIAENVKLQYAIEPEFAESQDFLGGVTNGYEGPTRLGIDRWVTIVAAWKKCHHACVVIDAGTAITVDVIDPTGSHSGGYIVPGLDTMHHSLTPQTRDVRVPKSLDSGEIEDNPKSTEDAVSCGIGLMTRTFETGVIERFCAKWSNEVSIFVTGGDGEYFMQDNAQFSWCPELVLDGIGLALP